MVRARIGLYSMGKYVRSYAHIVWGPYLTYFRAYEYPQYMIVVYLRRWLFAQMNIRVMLLLTRAYGLMVPLTHDPYFRARYARRDRRVAVRHSSPMQITVLNTAWDIMGTHFCTNHLDCCYTDLVESWTDFDKDLYVPLTLITNQLNRMYLNFTRKSSVFDEIYYWT